MDLRKSGVRVKKAYRATSTPGTPMSALTSTVGDVTINSAQMEACRSLYHTSPSMQAARSVLLGQLLSSGIVVRRKGEDVVLTESFSKHLESFWVPFVRKCFDDLIVQGFVAVSIEEELPDPFAGLGAPPGKRRRSTTGSVGDDSGQETKNLVPEVCDPGTYQLSFAMGGRVGYRREYRVKSLAPGNQYNIDNDVGLFFRTHPDINGNLCSPVACCFEQVSFVSALLELALQAEVVRSRTQLITQSAVKPAGGPNSLDAASLFFDSESRAIHQSDQTEEAVEQAAALSLVSRLCATINRLQTRGEEGSSRSSAPVHAPPEVPPRLFTIPEKQQLAPSPRAPESRTDLEALLRQSNESVCAAMGVPASVIFEGKFSSNSMSQLQLLNTTVSGLAITLNSILTACYRACYAGAAITDEDELMLVTAPLSATSEVEQLYTSGVIDWMSALPAALHSLGCPANEITEAVRRRKEKEGQEAKNSLQATYQNVADDTNTRAEDAHE